MPWLSNLSNRLSDFVSPEVARVFVALAVVVTGYVAARIVRYIARRYFRRASARLVGFFQRFSGQPRNEPALELAQEESAAVAVAAGIVFWLVLVLFLSIAASFLGLSAVSNWFAGLAAYLPRALAAAAAILIGIFVGRFAGAFVTSAAHSGGLAQARTLGRVAQVAIVVPSIFIAVDELGVEVTILVVLIGIALTAALGSLALAFGLGARTTVSNLVASYYLSRWYRVGQTVRVGDASGSIVHILPTAVVLRTEAGQLYVPAKAFAEGTSMLVTEGSES